jgi:hypothetical protein
VRLRYALFVLLFSISLTGQEEPLPPVTPRAPSAEVMLIALASEPIRDYREPSLADAARNNDYVTFDALYREAKARGENVAAFDALHALWTYNVTDPIGAFYGADMYERLSRAYPGFAAFIADHSIVDSNGNVFYPTSETREFVLARALEGRTTSRTLVAGDLLSPPTPAPVQSARNDDGLRARRSSRTTTKPATSVVAEKTQKTAPAATIKSGGQAILPVPAAAPAAVPVPAHARASQSATGQAGLPVLHEAAPAPVFEAKEPVAIPEPIAPVVIAQQQPAQTSTQQQPLVDASATSRGILLIVIGLLGVGLLAVMFRTPKETVPPSIVTTTVKPAEPVANAEDEKPVAPVEPLRRPAGGRANGSRG